jgi:anti-anti-sigma factor
VASLVTGAVVVLTMLAFAPLFSDLPNPVLGAVIIDAVIFGMIDIPEFRRMFNIKRSDFYIAIAAVVGVLVAGVLAGIVIGVVLSVGWLVYRVTSPPMPVLGRDRETHVFREHEEHPGDEQFPGILVLSLGGGLYFVTSEALGDRIRDLVLTSPSPPACVILDCGSVQFIDSQGSGQLASGVEAMRAEGITFRLARVRPRVLGVLEKDGVLDKVGRENVHTGLNDAVQAQLGQAAATP